MEKLSVEFAARMCPQCGADSLVYDSREFRDGSIIRRRKCQVCGTKFETIEHFSKYIKKREEKFFQTQDVENKNQKI